VKWRCHKWTPLLITAGVVIGIGGIKLVCSVFPALDLLDRLECMTYDCRIRCGRAFTAPCSTNLAAVFIDNETVDELARGVLVKPRIAWPFPRHIHAGVIRELSAQGARIVGMDILFDQLRSQDAAVVLTKTAAMKLGFTEDYLAAVPSFPIEPGNGDTNTPAEQGVLIESDALFAHHLQQCSNVVLAAIPELMPHASFLTNALAVGNVEGSKPESEEKDSDGILRRFKAFVLHRQWHPAVLSYATRESIDLQTFQTQENQILFARADGKKDSIRLTGDEIHFPEGKGPGYTVKVGLAEFPFVDKRLWHFGLVLGAQYLKLDLEGAEVDLAGGRIILAGPGGVRRTIPVDNQGRFLIDWELTWNDSRLMTLSYGALVALDQIRHGGGAPEKLRNQYLERLRQLTGKTNLIGDAPFRDCLVVIGSTMTGNNLSDMGPSPLSKQTYLVSSHWNAANSLIKGRFIQTVPFWGELMLVLVMAGIAFWLTQRHRTIRTLFGVAVVGVGYVGISLILHVCGRLWLPVVLPLVALLLVFACLEIYELLFTQSEQRRIKAIFSRLVSPDVVEELLQEERLSLGGARRPVTIYFADARGFTEFAETSHAHAVEEATQRGYLEAEREAYLDSKTREVLETINLYLSGIARAVKKHHGTLDKYIGDCVMAFWGAPTANSRHAADCVRAAIDAQLEIHRLNCERQAENQRRSAENARRQQEGQPLLTMLPVVSFGTGISSGVVTVGLMGSDEHILNYTVFGREVNLASRMEAVSGRGRILITAATYAELVRDDPDLASKCVKQPPVLVKGFHGAIEVYEVPWKSLSSDSAICGTLNESS